MEMESILGMETLVSYPRRGDHAFAESRRDSQTSQSRRVHRQASPFYQNRVPPPPLRHPLSSSNHLVRRIGDGTGIKIQMVLLIPFLAGIPCPKLRCSTVSIIDLGEMKTFLFLFKTAQVRVPRVIARSISLLYCMAYKSAQNPS
jgi:hypothetical protein